ncbi:MAG: PH domain-containing protein [Bacteroidales bacterium]|nr:PH domain-containing protein [Bacteroidales bacterium]
MKKYPSKIGIGIAIFIIVVITGVSVKMTMEKEWIALATNFFVFIILYWLYKSTYYTIDGNTLRIKSGFLINEKIDINTISKVLETSNPLSAPAFSLDRLNVRYNKSSSVLISPRDKTGFIKELLKVNSKIEIDYKK